MNTLPIEILAKVANHLYDIDTYSKFGRVSKRCASVVHMEEIYTADYRITEIQRYRYGYRYIARALKYPPGASTKCKYSPHAVVLSNGLRLTYERDARAFVCDYGIGGMGDAIMANICKFLTCPSDLLAMLQVSKYVAAVVADHMEDILDYHSYSDYGMIRGFVTYTFGYLHSRNDQPAVISPDGTLAWYRYGEIYREGRPAVIESDGESLWSRNGHLYRECDLPAIDTNYRAPWYRISKRWD
jgi:hypothetical protein